MAKSEMTAHYAENMSTATADEGGAVVYWNHVKTVVLVMATLSLYFCEMLLLVGGGAFARSIAAVIGGDNLTSWPALVLVIFTVALCPPIAQAADYWGRKWFLVIPNIFGFVGSIVVARATTFNIAIAGFCIGGIAYGSQSLFLTVVSEVLPRKYRSYGQAAANASVALGSIFSLCVGGYLTQNNATGFRTYFYITAGIYAGATILCAVLYNSPPRELQVTLTTSQKLRSLDWVGYVLLTAGTVLLCLGLSWAQNPYPWTDAHVLAPFLLGILFLIVLIVYAWKFKKDGLLHHTLFRDRNFPIALISVFIEGMAFMAANVYFPYSLSVLQASTMGPFRQALCYNTAFCTFAVAALVAGLYIHKTRTVRVPGMLTFVSFIVFFAMMASITATTGQAYYWGTIIFYGLGLGICLVTFVTAAQFSTPPELIAITSGLLLSLRSLGGSIGVAIFNSIFAHGLSSNLVPKVTAAVKPLGLSAPEIGPLISALSVGNLTLAESLHGVTLEVIGAAGLAMDQAYVIGFRDVFVCGGAFSVVALIIAGFLHNPVSEFNAKIDAPIEIIVQDGDIEKTRASGQHIEDRQVEI